jgi:hypothetical protein
VPRRIFKRLLGIIIGVFLFSMNAVASNGNDFDIQLNQEDTKLVYGDYIEIELNASINEEVEFTLSEEMFPVGLTIVQLTGNSALLAGVPEFLEKFCFILEAKSKTTQREATKRICLYSENNENLDHPKFEETRYLESFTKGEFSEITIRLDASSDHLEPGYVLGQLPEGLDIQSSTGEAKIFGTPNYQGVFEIVFMVKEETSQGELYTYKQFQIEVKPETETRYQCDEGYYYDETLGYCIQNAGSTCRNGTFYDPSTNTCVQYRTPPHISCSPGYHYDHFQYRCVRSNTYRCPLNYEYDSWYGRCVRLPYTCSIGYRYDWNFRTCVYAGFRTCNYGYHYNSYRGRCVRNFNSCRPGYYWNGYSCNRTVRYCSGNRYYDPISGGCRLRNTYRSCRPGWNYSYNRGTCVRVTHYRNRTCSSGSRWDHGRRSCVRYRVPNRRPPRTVRRPARRTTPVVVRPTPRPNRPNRPETRPNRPNRPETRPNRPNRPETRPNRPNRPETRPNRPNRPETRPNRPNRPETRPNRPSRPETRPNRPNRPETRPNRPSRPQRETRPSRPSRPQRETRPSRPSRPQRETRPSRPSRPQRETRPSRPSRPQRETRPSRSRSDRGSSRGSSRRRRN